jgi:hypothetical protein
MAKPLSGYFAYAAAGCAIAYAAAGYILGQLDLNTAIGFALGGSGVGALHHHLSSKYVDLAEKVAPLILAAVQAVPSSAPVAAPAVAPVSPSTEKKD